MSTWYSKHVEENISRINNIKCITLVFCMIKSWCTVRETLSYVWSCWFISIFVLSHASSTAISAHITLLLLTTLRNFLLLPYTHIYTCIYTNNCTVIRHNDKQLVITYIFRFFSAFLQGRKMTKKGRHIHGVYHTLFIIVSNYRVLVFTHIFTYLAAWKIDYFKFLFLAKNSC